jgi:hypothetical protein
MPTASMPKASIHEHREVATPENKIGATGKILLSPPSRDAMLAKDGDEFELSIFVATALYRRHATGTLRLGKNVGHQTRNLDRLPPQ